MYYISTQINKEGFDKLNECLKALVNLNEFVLEYDK